MPSSRSISGTGKRNGASSSLGGKRFPSHNESTRESTRFRSNSFVTPPPPYTPGRNGNSAPWTPPGVAADVPSSGGYVVGHEFGPERVLSVTSKVDASREGCIVNERYIEHEVIVPKKITREEIVEKVIIVPEKIVHEEIVEEVAKVREKIVEIARPRIVEKVVEQIEHEYVEKIVEVPEVIVQDRIQHVDKIIQEERIVEVPKIIPVEKPYDVPEIHYRDVPYERVVEVEDWRDEIITKEVPVPQYVDEPVPNIVQVEKMVDIERNIPIPVEAEVTYEFRIPKIKPRYHKITYPVYLPRFIEVPVGLHLLTDNQVMESENDLKQLGQLVRNASSLCVIENLATKIIDANLTANLSDPQHLQKMILQKWKDDTLIIHPSTKATNHRMPVEPLSQRSIRSRS